MHAVKDAGIMVPNTSPTLNGTKMGVCCAARPASSLYHDQNATRRATGPNIKGIRTTIVQSVKVNISVLLFHFISVNIH